MPISCKNMNRDTLTPKYLWIDFIKIFSMFYIIIFHWYQAYFDKIDYFSIFIRETFSNFLANPLTKPLIISISALPLLGYQGVGVFFLVSGIGLTLSINRGNSWGHFIFKRFIRIYIPYWIALIFSVFIIILLTIFDIKIESPVFRIHHTFSEWFHIVTLTNDIIPKWATFFNGTWWFLNVIILYYLAFPFFYRTLQKRRGTIFLYLLISLLIRFFYNYYKIDLPPYPVIVFALRFFEFIFGIYIGITLIEDRYTIIKFFDRICWLAPLLWLYSTYLRYNKSFFLISDTVITILFFFSIYAIYKIVRHSNFLMKVAGYITPIFYEVYLIHYLFIAIMILKKGFFLFSSLLLFSVIIGAAYFLKELNNLLISKFSLLNFKNI